MHLPPNPSVENLKKQAKSLLKAHREQDPEVVEYIRRHLPRLNNMPDEEILVAELSLQEAQLVIAREYGFPSWPKLVEGVEGLADEAAGDLPNLFSEEVKIAMNLAREETARLGHDYIGTEHLLLGLIRAARAHVDDLLTGVGLDVDLDEVATVVEDWVGGGHSIELEGTIPHTPRAKVILKAARTEARALGDHVVRGRHMFLALIKDPEALSTQVAQEFGVGFGSVKRYMEANPLTVTVSFNDEARRAMGAAREEALRLRHDEIGTEHLLLGLLAAESSHVGDILDQLGLSAPVVSQAVKDRMTIGEQTAVTENPRFTSRATKILDTSRSEAVALDQSLIGVGHLLLALLKDEEAIAAQVLAEFGVGQAQVREIVTERA